MDSLEGLETGLKTLTLRGNKLEILPDLSVLKDLEVVDLQDNPLLCDCPLMPLRKLVTFSLNLFLRQPGKSHYGLVLQFLLSYRWMENVGLEVMATCGNPAEVKGQKVREVHVFKLCPESKSPKPEAARPLKLNARKLTSKGFKEKQIKPKLKKLNTTKRRPQAKPKETKKKKTQ